MPQPTYESLDCRLDGGILVLTLRLPELHGEEALQVLGQELAAAVGSVESPRVVLDCHQVRFVTAEGLRALLEFRRHLRQRDGQLLLTGLSDEVAEVFFTTNLASVTPSMIIPFALAPDVPTAVSHLSLGRDAP